MPIYINEYRLKRVPKAKKLGPEFGSLSPRVCRLRDAVLCFYDGELKIFAKFRSWPGAGARSNQAGV
jgi:hypothetical protein